jgi:glycosyltransferase involved in cell wall biosynthesis
MLQDRSPEPYMKSVPKISCIIPFWNEGEHLFEVLDEISKVRNLIEIICVDDASQEDNSAKIRTRYPQIKLIRLERNLGKSGAIREGLKHAKGDSVLLLDADLRNLNHLEIEQANEAFQQDDHLDMLILRRIQAIRFVKFYRADVLFTGERLLKKADLDIILKGRVNGWQLESVINMWMWRNHKKVLWMPHSGINTHKLVLLAFGCEGTADLAVQR